MRAPKPNITPIPMKTAPQKNFMGKTLAWWASLGFDVERLTVFTLTSYDLFRKFLCMLPKSVRTKEWVWKPYPCPVPP